MSRLPNSNNLKDLVVNAFQEILAEDPNFFFTDRLSILTWNSKKIKGALITKIGNRRYLGYLRKDSKGQEYWRYKPLTSHSEQSAEDTIPPSPNQLETDNVAKFQARQEKAINHDHNISEQSVNQSN